MNANDAVRPEVGTWYVRTDSGGLFQVVGYDEPSRTVEIQTFDGDLDEMDRDTWDTLPLEARAPPEDWTGPVDDVETDDLGYSETEMAPLEWSQPSQPRVPQEESEVASEATEEEALPEEDRDTPGEAGSAEPFVADIPGNRKRRR